MSRFRLPGAAALLALLAALACQHAPTAPTLSAAQLACRAQSTAERVNAGEFAWPQPGWFLELWDLLPYSVGCSIVGHCRIMGTVVLGPWQSKRAPDLTAAEAIDVCWRIPAFRVD
jgi:hypothetical protein